MSFGVTLVNYQRTNAPAQFAQLDRIAAPPPGYYEVTFIVFVSGTVAAAEQDNAVVNVVAGLSLPVVPAANAPVVPFTVPRILIVSGTDIILSAGLAGTAGSVYHAWIIATPIS